MALTWAALSQISSSSPNPSTGPANSQAILRVFSSGLNERDVRVTLFRDRFAWCPYCQKVWLFLEEKQIPYKVRKVAMFCYGEKEDWFKKLVPSGMLPALSIQIGSDAAPVLTESDDILEALESEFGSLGSYAFNGNEVVPLRRLERLLFRAWCRWLCYPNNAQEELAAEVEFCKVATAVNASLVATQGPYFLPEFSIADIVFAPYIERMRASLYYYKGFLITDQSRFPGIYAWFQAMEMREAYCGTQSDFHTHAHDLPPQMGGCYENRTAIQQQCKLLVDRGPWRNVPEVFDLGSVEDAKAEALMRVIKHREPIIQVNPDSDKSRVDEALRCVLTYLSQNTLVQPPSGYALALRHLRNQISIPRDMGIRAGKVLRQALEDIAALDGPQEPPALPTRHRRDQNSSPFLISKVSII